MQKTLYFFTMAQQRNIAQYWLCYCFSQTWSRRDDKSEAKILPDIWAPKDRRGRGKTQQQPAPLPYIWPASGPPLIFGIIPHAAPWISKKFADKIKVDPPNGAPPPKLDPTAMYARGPHQKRGTCWATKKIEVAIHIQDNVELQLQHETFLVIELRGPRVLLSSPFHCKIKSFGTVHNSKVGSSH